MQLVAGILMKFLEKSKRQIPLLEMKIDTFFPALLFVLRHRRNIRKSKSLTQYSYSYIELKPYTQLQNARTMVSKKHTTVTFFIG